MKSGDTPTYVKLSSTSEEHCAPVTALQVVKDVGEDYEADEKGDGIGCTAVYVAIGCDLALRHAERRHQTACHALWPFFGLSCTYFGDRLSQLCRGLNLNIPNKTQGFVLQT